MMISNRCILCAVLFAVLLVLGSCGQQSIKEPLEPPRPTAQSASDEWKASSESSQVSQLTSEQVNQSDIKLYLNGNRLELQSTPVMQEDNVMVPLAEICGYFSRPIECVLDGQILTVQDSNNKTVFKITAGSDIAELDGKQVAMPAAAQLDDKGAMLVELSCFRTLLDADNRYNDEFSAAYITESGLC